MQVPVVGIGDGHILCNHKAYVWLSTACGVCHSDMLRCTLEVHTGSAGGEKAKRTGERTEPNWRLEWGGEGPFLLPSSPLGSLCLPLFCFVFFFLFHPNFCLFSPLRNLVQGQL